MGLTRRSQGSAYPTVLLYVLTFAQHLQAAMQRPPSPPRSTPWVDALADFENAIAGWHGLRRPTEQDAHWVSALGLSLPCTIEDVKRAFRRLAFQTHPDRPGGSHEAFLEAQALLREAVEAIEKDLVQPQAPTPVSKVACRFKSLAEVKRAGCLVHSFG